jgi:hypothetical protein
MARVPAPCLEDRPGVIAKVAGTWKAEIFAEEIGRIQH